MRKEGQERVQKALLKAGYYYPAALADFRAVRSLLTLLPLFFALELALLWEDHTIMLFIVAYGIIASVIGFSVPRLYVNRQGEERSQRIKQSLPRALDLLSLCLTAGVNLIDAFGYVGRQMLATHPVLANEMLLTYRQAELRSLGHALMRMAERVQTPELSTVAYTLTQAEELGASTSAALLELSNSLRTNLRQQAEAQASRTSFWMLFPTTCCLFVAAAIIVIGPGVLEIVREGSELDNLNKESRSLIQQANRPARLVNPAPPPPTEAGPP